MEDCLDLDSKSPSKYAWPSVLQRRLGIPEMRNLSFPGASNDAITRILIKTISDLEHKPEDVFIVPMWTDLSRCEFSIENKWQKFGSWFQDDWPVSELYRKEFTNERKLQENLDSIRSYYKHLYTPLYGASETLKNIHYVQEFLKNNNLDYFMLFSFLSKNCPAPIYGPSYKNDEGDLSHYETMINWDKIDQEPFVQWCLKNHFEEDGMHFFDDAHEAYVEKILQNKGLIDVSH